LILQDLKTLQNDRDVCLEGIIAAVPVRLSLLVKSLGLTN
jgi:hypothetical protein